VGRSDFSPILFLLLASCTEIPARAERAGWESDECLARLARQQELSVEFCAQQCEQGNGASCVLAAQALEQGRLVPRDDGRAKELYATACRNRNAEGCYYTALELDGEGSREHSAVLYEKACNASYAETDSEAIDAVIRSCIEAGNLSNKKNDVRTAVKRFKRACELGYSGPLLRCPITSKFE
jgi:TPR repeat protein